MGLIHLCVLGSVSQKVKTENLEDHFVVCPSFIARSLGGIELKLIPNIQMYAGVETKRGVKFRTQHAMPPEFGGKWGGECLNTRFRLPTLLCGIQCEADFIYLKNYVVKIMTCTRFASLWNIKRKTYLYFKVTPILLITKTVSFDTWPYYYQITNKIYNNT